MQAKIKYRWSSEQAWNSASHIRLIRDKENIITILYLLFHSKIER